MTSATDVWPGPKERLAYYFVPGPIDAECAAALFGTSDAHTLRNFARDPQTPLEILRDLGELRGIGNAAAIRHAARINLRRQGIDPDAEHQAP